MRFFFSFGVGWRYRDGIGFSVVVLGSVWGRGVGKVRFFLYFYVRWLIYIVKRVDFFLEE